uniref:Uncharacterized protein n=1 Tax=Timema douglasi TaxID=61478 RepID=A0A7R8VLQ9_TIMDO|nr:unnamed protein product [Timema douglasi]
MRKREVKLQSGEWFYRQVQGRFNKAAIAANSNGRVENHFGETTLSTTKQDSSLGLPVIGSLVYCETSALDHAANEAGLPLN